MTGKPAPSSPERRDLKKLKRLLSLAIADLDTARRDESLLKSAPVKGAGPDGKAVPEQYDLKKIDAFVDLIARCDQLRRDLYDLPTSRDVREMAKQRLQKEEQDSSAGCILLMPVGEQDTDCPEVDN